MNTITIHGTIGANAETAEKNGKAYAKASIASDNGKGEQAGTTWFNLVGFEDKAELVGQLQKGQFVKITGSMRESKHNGKTYTSVIVRKVEEVAKKASA